MGGRSSPMLGRGHDRRTTDVDETGDQALEPRISPAETAYLEAWLAATFPSLALTAANAVSSMAGVRPVVGAGKADPSAESREHVVWEENGLVTVTGGKLTTFDAIARDALHRIGPRLGGRPAHAGGASGPGNGRGTGPLDALPPAATLADSGIEPGAFRRLVGRHGRETAAAIAAAGPGEVELIDGARDRWLDLRWAARAEGVVHLDDLLLRRVRLGLQLPEGGTLHLRASGPLRRSSLAGTMPGGQPRKQPTAAFGRRRTRRLDPEQRRHSLATWTVSSSAGAGTLPPDPGGWMD